VERYLYTARRYLWVITVILAILAISGSLSAFTEYVTTYESSATIWIARNSQSVLQTIDSATTDQPTLPNFQTPANEYAEVLSQFVQTQAFLREVIDRSSLKEGFAGAADQVAYLEDIRKRFRVQALGMNLVKVSFRASSPQLTFEMVSATLAVRDERTLKDQLGATSSSSLFYQREFDGAQIEAIRAQKQLDDFNSAHPGPWNAADDYKQRQLRLASDLAQIRTQDLKTRVDRASIASALLQLSQGPNVEVIDHPEVPKLPSGGLRPAAFLLGVALSGGVALAGLVVVLGTLLQASIASEADLGRLGAATLFATIPHVARRRSKGARGEIRAALAAAAFGRTSQPQTAEAGT